MASASIPAPSATRKRRPSPDLILRTYRQECIIAGDRGAANRAAALLGISDDTVRRVVARDEAARKAREETPPELQFTPPDAAYEAERDIINRRHAAVLAARLSPDVRQSYVKNERGSGDFATNTPHDDAADRRTGELGNTPHAGTLNAAPRSSDELDPQGDDVPLWAPGNEPGHARPDIDNPGAEAPELPPEAFPNPEPNQPHERSELPHHDRPLGPSDSPTTDRQSVPDWPTSSPTDRRHYSAEHPRPVPVPPGPPEPEPLPDPDPSPVPTPPLYRPQRVIIRVAEPRQVGGLVGWLSTNPMLGPVPVWALLLLGFGALLVQLGLLG